MGRKWRERKCLRLFQSQTLEINLFKNKAKCIEILLFLQLGQFLGNLTRLNRLTAVLFQCILRWMFVRMSGLLLTSLRASFTAGITPCPILAIWWPRDEDVGKKPARWTSWRWWRCRRGCSSSPKLPPSSLVARAWLRRRRWRRRPIITV